MRTKFLFRGAVGSFVAAAILVAVTGSCFAQSWTPPVRSVIPWLSYIETYTGPLLPPGPIGSTFRSEFGAGLATAQLQGAKFIGSSVGELDLRTAANLDKGPLKLDVFANFRLWRFGLRLDYTDFETRSKHRDYGRVDFTGVNVGGDLDLLYHPWAAFGVRADLYYFEPTFRGVLLDPTGNPDLTLDVRGQKPATVGPYVRYTPPEILNAPMQFEIFYNIPLNGARFTSYGMKLAFRPQIYRMDIAARILLERCHLKFQGTPRSEFTSLTLPPVTYFPGQEWELDMEWDILGIDFTVYF